MKFRRTNNELLKMENCHHRDNGVAPAATFQRMICRIYIHVGVRRKLSHGVLLGCHLILAGRRARSLGLDVVRIRVS